MIWGTVMSQALGVLKNERISGGALIIMAAGLWGIYAWADTTHAELVPKADFDQLQHEVAVGFEKMDLNDASQEIRDIKLSLQIAKATAASDAELARITDELEHAQAYKECLRARGPNCEHLKEVE